MQGLVADVPLCCCSAKVLMWKSAGFFWWASNKDSRYVFNMFSRLSLLSWWSPASRWLKMKFYFSTWVYKELCINRLSMASQQKLLWPVFFFYLVLVTLVFAPFSFSQIFFSVFQDGIFILIPSAENRISSGMDLSAGCLSAVVARAALETVALVLMPGVL